MTIANMSMISSLLLQIIEDIEKIEIKINENQQSTAETFLLGFRPMMPVLQCVLKFDKLLFD